VPKYTYNNNWGASFLLEEIEEHLGFVGILNGLKGRDLKEMLTEKHAYNR